MSVRRVIRKRIRRHEDGLDLAMDLNADIVVNVGRTPPDSEDDERPPEHSTPTEDTPEEREEP